MENSGRYDNMWWVCLSGSQSIEWSAQMLAVICS